MPSLDDVEKDREALRVFFEANGIGDLKIVARRITLEPMTEYDLWRQHVVLGRAGTKEISLQTYFAQVAELTKNAREESLLFLTPHRKLTSSEFEPVSRAYVRHVLEPEGHNYKTNTYVEIGTGLIDICIVDRENKYHLSGPVIK